MFVLKLHENKIKKQIMDIESNIKGTFGLAFSIVISTKNRKWKSKYICYTIFENLITKYFLKTKENLKTTNPPFHLFQLIAWKYFWPQCGGTIVINRASIRLWFHVSGSNLHQPKGAFFFFTQFSLLSSTGFNPMASSLHFFFFSPNAPII